MKLLIKASVMVALFASLLFTVSCDDSGDDGSKCGNGVVDDGEECDGEKLGRYTNCSSLGFSSGTLRCTDQCTYDVSWCEHHCGNGTIEKDREEECDGDALDGKTCMNMGLGSGTLRCSSECKFDISGCEIKHRCGNGVLETGEQCDGSISSVGTCEQLGFNKGGSLTCRNDCIIDYSQCNGETNYDSDNDGVPDPVDNCPGTFNEPPKPYEPQSDRDKDGIGDACDNCPDTPNPDQMDSNDDGHGDACTEVNDDFDGDGVPNATDNCPYTYNTNQTDRHEDGIGDLCQYSSVSTGADFTCAITLDAEKVVCWGHNDSGQLGNGSNSDSLLPVLVMTENENSGNLVPLQNIRQISAGQQHVCAVSFNGRAYCWGINDYGQLGSGTGSDSSTAMPVVSSMGGYLKNVMYISSGEHHTCAVLTDSTVWCWGNNESGQLGDGSTDGSMEAVKVKTDFSGNTLSGIVEVASGQRHTCALHEDGHTVYCWGNNSASQCGVDSQQNMSLNYATQVPLQQTEISSITGISAGGDFTCVSGIASDDSTAVWCWGGNALGQLGCGSCAEVTSTATPVRVISENGTYLANVSDFNVGFSHSCAIDADNVVVCWGGNYAGQLGIDDGVTTSATVVQVHASTTDSNEVFSVLGGSISAGYEHTCATRPVPGNGAYGMEIWCWGNNSFGQLGTGNTESGYVPVPVADVAARK